MADNNITIDTTRFGKINIAKKKIYSFPDGIPGFPSNRDYCILDNNKNALFKWLQSMDNPDLAFVIFDPFLIKNDYDFIINDDDLSILQVEKREEIIVTVILTIPSGNPEEMTANFKAPLIFNINKKVGKQIILNDYNYPLEFPVWNAISNKAENNHQRN